jgi:hypothetical protein
LGDIFQIVSSAPDTSRMEYYQTAVQRRGRGFQVEIAMRELLKDIRILATEHAIKEETKDQVNNLDDAIDNLSDMEPSSPFSSGDLTNIRDFFITHTGTQNINTGSGMQYNGNIMYFGKSTVSSGRQVTPK